MTTLLTLLLLFAPSSAFSLGIGGENARNSPETSSFPSTGGENARNSPEIVLPSQPLTLEEVIALITGASDISEVPVEDFERLQSLHNHPLRINRCGRKQLQSSGLFTQYQIETILDYRSRNGDILSVVELAVVDGFTTVVAHRLSLFLDFSQGGVTTSVFGVASSFDGTAGLGGISDHGTDFSGEASAGVSYKINEGKGNWQWQGKVTSEIDSPLGKFTISSASKSPWAGAPPQPNSAATQSPQSASRPQQPATQLQQPDSHRPLLQPAYPQALGWSLGYSDPYGISETVIGSFNARFAQGLLLWSGTSFNSYATPSALMKRPSGLSPYRSYSPDYSLSGIASSIDAGQFSIRAFLDCGTFLTDISKTRKNSVKPLRSFGGNLSWNHRHGQVGFSGLLYSDHQGYSLDFQQTVSGAVLYGEVALTLDGIGWAGRRAMTVCPSALLGADYHYANFELGLRTSYVAGTHNITGAISWMSDNRKHLVEAGATSDMNLNLQQGRTDFSMKKLKSRITYTATPDSTWKFITFFAFNSNASTSTKSPPKPKFELRQDVIWDSGLWNASARGHFAYCRTPAFAAYAEAGCRFGLPSHRDSSASSAKLSTYAQAGIFRADTWEDRIYVYMRDVPGNFNVPAMYGRGYWLSATAKAIFLKKYSAYLKLQYTDYPWARPEDTHQKASLLARISFQVDF